MRVLFPVKGTDELIFLQSIQHGQNYTIHRLFSTRRRRRRTQTT
ncbi:hypothetical protein MtrunA17_Chr4g0068401 [Medicago truncatula]|uniref:Uncharacterized protein n=1 Tax=Medicago truncatula TaxID=3880 RepID=A0A396IHN4_MEDTR|nr:hypothetical protein MtrunA17_Chr4g0068401 [Medicago truncatula]